MDTGCSYCGRDAVRRRAWVWVADAAKTAAKDAAEEIRKVAPKHAV